MLAVEHEGTDDLPAALDRYRRRAEMLARDGTVPAPPEAVRA
jgi:hypothetical protein